MRAVGWICYYSRGKIFHNSSIPFSRSTEHIIPGGCPHQQDDRHRALQRADLQPGLAPLRPPLLRRQCHPQEAPREQPGRWSKIFILHNKYNFIKAPNWARRANLWTGLEFGMLSGPYLSFLFTFHSRDVNNEWRHTRAGMAWPFKSWPVWI